MLDQIWNLDDYSWERIIEEPIKTYCCPPIDEMLP